MKWIRVVGSIAAFAVACALAWAFGTAMNQPAVSDLSAKPGTQVAHLLRSDHKHPAPPPPVVEEAAPVEEVYEPSITYCPAGTVAGAVDSAGNESNCYETNPDTGQQCAAYDDANNCTAWYQP